MLRSEFSGVIQKNAPMSAPSDVEENPAMNENNFFWKQAQSQAQCLPALPGSKDWASLFVIFLTFGERKKKKIDPFNHGRGQLVKRYN